MLHEVLYNSISGHCYQCCLATLYFWAAIDLSVAYSYCGNLRDLEEDEYGDLQNVDGEAGFAGVEEHGGGCDVTKKMEIGLK